VAIARLCALSGLCKNGEYVLPISVVRDRAVAQGINVGLKIDVFSSLRKVIIPNRSKERFGLGRLGSSKKKERQFIPLRRGKSHSDCVKVGPRKRGSGYFQTSYSED